MKQLISAILRTVGRVLFLVVFGYLLTMIVSLLATLLLAVCFGSLERGLEQLPKSRYFEPAVLGYFAAVCAAGIGFLMGGLLRIPVNKKDFYRAVWTKVLPVATVAAVVATAGGIGVAFFGLSRETSTLVAFGTGIWVGIVIPLAAWVALRFNRGPAESE